MKLFSKTKKLERKAFYSDEIKDQFRKAEELKNEYLKRDYFGRIFR